MHCVALLGTNEETKSNLSYYCAITRIQTTHYQRNVNPTIPPYLRVRSRLTLSINKSTEPTEDWTVEQLLQWCLQKSQSSVNSKTDELINSLQEMQHNAERDIWELHNLAVQNLDTGDADGDVVDADGPKRDVEVPAVGEENIEPNVHVNATKMNSEVDDCTKPTGSKAASSTKTTESNTKPNQKAKKKNTKNLFISIRTGPHEGATFLLKPRQSRPCEIGRSKGKKFLQRGISLFKDSEVSTCHGKFEFKAGKMFYTDTGSTNGTSFRGEAIEDNEPMELSDGLVLVFGESELEFTIVDN